MQVAPVRLCFCKHLVSGGFRPAGRLKRGKDSGTLDSLQMS